MRKSRKEEGEEKRVIKWAVMSRLLVVMLMVGWRSMVFPYDTSSKLSPSGCLQQQGEDSGGNSSSSSSSGLGGGGIQNSVVWDSVYYVRIAECGYEYEQYYAFMPLLPLSSHLLSRSLFAPLLPLLGFRPLLALSAYALNNSAFVLSALYFYRLSVAVLQDTEYALRASILFCFNPASIFYSSIYSESLYSLFSIGGLYHLISGANTVAALSFALSACARSNGLLNAGYFCFQTMHQLYDVFSHKTPRPFPFLAVVKLIVVGTMHCACIFSLFIAFQAYGYHNICSGRSPDQRSPWCNAKIPLLYNYIQSHYWGVGFLRYFQLKQLPNFLLALPILSLALCSIIHFVRSEADIFRSLGFGAFKTEKRAVASFSRLDEIPRSDGAQLVEKSSKNIFGSHNLWQRRQITGKDDHATRATEYNSLGSPRGSPAFIVPCILHLGFMVATAFFIMHVQVATRFLSASPPLYWFAAHIMASPKYKSWGYVIWAYCIGYILLGSLLFSNFYPFT